MKKATIKRLLAVVVGVLIIAASLTAGFSAFADDAVNAEPLNLDFSDGFNHWAGQTTIYSNDGGILKVNDSYSGSWKFLKTEPFNIPNAVAGTTVQVSFDVAFEDGLPSMDGNDNQEGTLNSQVGYKILDVFLGDPAIDDHMARIGAYTESNGQRNEVFYNEEGTVVVGPVTMADPAEAYDFWIGCGNSARNTWEVTNITVKVTHPDGTVETYPATEQGDEDDEQGSGTTPPAGPKYPAYFGSETDGVDSNLTHYPSYLTPADDIYNLDFSDGFIFWGGNADAGHGSFASDAFDIITEGDNKYAKIKEDGYVSSISTVLFKAKNVQVGDNLVVIYDAKGADVANLRIRLRQDFLKEESVYDPETGLTTTMKADGSGLLNPSPGVPATMVGTSLESAEFAVQTDAAGWKTYIAETNTSVQDPKSSQAQASTSNVLRDDIFLQVAVTCPNESTGVNPGDLVDAAIDNIIIAKVVDGKYINVADNSVVYDPNAGTGNGGGNDGGNGGTGTGNGGNGGSSTTGDSVLALAALFFISGAAVFGTAKAMKNR